MALVLGIASVALSAPALAQDAKWGPHIDVEGKLGTKRNLGETDAFIPLAQDGATLLFANIRARMDDSDSAEGNFGLGIRHMLESGWNLGTYGYFDRRKSEWDNYFSQATFGLEALSLDWDLRANYYAPLGGRVRQVEALNAASISGTSVVFRGGEEHSLGGFDAEIGWRVPLFDAEADRQLRVYGGGYRFTADNVPDVSGPRFRAEMTFDAVPGLWDGARFSVGAEWQNDDPRGSQGFLSARLRIPLQSYGKPAAQLTAMERRMADPIVRDVDVVAQAGAFGAVEIATQTANDQGITVLSSASTSGAGLQTALNTAGTNSTVILQGGFNTAGAITTLQAGQTLMGAGQLAVRAPSGRVAMLTTQTATLTGNVGGANYTVVMANNSTLTGLTINNTDGTANNAQAVRVSGVSNVKIINNTINATQQSTGTAHGIDVLSGSSNVLISGNTINAIGSGSSGVTLAIQVQNSSVTVTNNILKATGATAAGNNDYVTLNSANILSGSTGNTALAGVCDIGAAGGGSTISFTNAAACGP